ncbi:MAG: DUF929 family protein [Nitrososphaerota archaeon]|jgi:thiol-disulfide isomerase/thioredoxin|nr:DUF929 family protein [Nitrososphaerota archaeon]MDG6978267.1 DUF929 family protein [Nitrososphaerota archaeon]
MSRKTRRSGAKRSYRAWIFVGLVVLVAVFGYFIFTTANSSGGSSPLINQPVSQTILDQLAGVNTTTLAQVGSGGSGVQIPSSITGSPLTFNGKPEVLYMGAEFCPYCAAERWAMIVALDKFGTFTGLQYMQSTGTDVYPNTSTFTFANATYTSNYISFVPVEMDTRAETPLQTPTSAQTALMTAYDSSNGAIPFIDFGNQYVIKSSSYVPNVLRVSQNAAGAPLNWTEIAAQLNTPSSVVAQNIDGTANHIISAICKIDGSQPTSICSQSFATLLSYTPSSSGGQPIAASAAVSGAAPSAAAAGFSPSRTSSPA